MSDFRTAVLGNKNTTLLFQAFGAEVHGVEDGHEARTILQKLLEAVQNEDPTQPQYAVIFVEEEFYKTFPDDFLKKLGEKALPAVTPIPSLSSTDKKFGQKRLSKIVERAIGSDI